MCWWVDCCSHQIRCRRRTKRQLAERFCIFVYNNNNIRPVSGTAWFRQCMACAFSDRGQMSKMRLPDNKSSRSFQCVWFVFGISIVEIQLIPTGSGFQFKTVNKRTHETMRWNSFDMSAAEQTKLLNPYVCNKHLITKSSSQHFKCIMSEIVVLVGWTNKAKIYLKF